MSVEKLKDYIGFKLQYVPIMNILMVSKHNYYNDLGEYIMFIYKDEKMPSKMEVILSYLSINALSSIIRNQESIAIIFITSLLNCDALYNMFGSPLMHREFGEGFDNKKLNKVATYASYFVNVGGVELHIGYDHRGTSIETLELDADKLMVGLKGLVDLYYSKS